MTRRNTPPVGVPVATHADEDFTPVHSVMERMEEMFVPTERERMLLHLVWQHTANMELRARQRADQSDTGAIERRVDAVETAIVDIRGEHGNNGKLGNLRGRLDGALSKAWWLVTVLVGGVVGAAVKLIMVGRAYGELETRVDEHTTRVHMLEQAVYLQPEKDKP